MKDFKILFFNNIKGRFNLKEFRDIPVNKTSFKQVLTTFGGFNTKNSSIKPDFFVKDISKIIEFDGVYWHRKNPENKKREEKRDREIKEAGYDVYHVNESEYHQNSKETIQKCINFIRG